MEILIQSYSEPSKGEPVMTFEEFIRKLKYNVQLSMPINEEAYLIDFPYYTTTSNDNFVKYIISLSYWYGEHLVVERSDLKAQKFRFKCSYERCGMKRNKIRSKNE